MRNTLLLSGILMIGLTAVSSAAEKVSMKEKENRSSQESMLKEKTDWTKEKCGQEIPATIDWSTFKPGVAQDTYSISGYCEAPYSVMNMLCESKLGQDSVKAGVKKVICKFGGKGKRAA